MPWLGSSQCIDEKNKASFREFPLAVGVIRVSNYNTRHRNYTVQFRQQHQENADMLYFQCIPSAQLQTVSQSIDSNTHYQNGIIAMT